VRTVRGRVLSRRAELEQRLVHRERLRDSLGRDRGAARRRHTDRIRDRDALAEHVDADLRRAVIDRTFEIPRSPGLTEFLVGSSPDAPAQTALLHVKSNLGPLAPPLDYRIGEAGNFHWTGLSNLTPEDLLAARPTGAGLPKRKFAAQWLRDCLQPGSQTQCSIEIAAERDGVCITTLRRAKFDIGVRSSKDGKSGAWWWTLPPPED